MSEPDSADPLRPEMAAGQAARLPEDLHEPVRKAGAGFPPPTVSAGQQNPSSDGEHPSSKSEHPSSPDRAEGSEEGPPPPPPPGSIIWGKDRYKVVWADWSHGEQIERLFEQIDRFSNHQLFYHALESGQAIVVQDTARADHPIVAATGFGLFEEPPKGLLLVDFAAHPGYWGNYELAFATVRGAANKYSELCQEFPDLPENPGRIAFEHWSDEPRYVEYMDRFFTEIDASRGPPDFITSIPFGQAKEFRPRDYNRFPIFQRQQHPRPDLGLVRRRNPGKGGASPDL